MNFCPCYRENRFRWLLVGIGSGLLSDFFRSESLDLQYTINSAEMFPG